MDLSPVWISLKTSVVSIIITFFLGLWAARGVVSVRSAKAKAWLDGLLTLPLVLPPTVAGFFLLYLFGAKRPAGIFLQNSVQLAGNRSGGCRDLVSTDVPLGERCDRAGRRESCLCGQNAWHE